MKNFYLFYGENKELVNKEIDGLVNKLSISSASIIKYDIEDINSIIREAETVSLFSSCKMIVIDSNSYFSEKKITIDIDLLDNYINNCNKDSYLVFIVNSNSIDTRKKLYKLILSNGIIKKVDITDNDLNKYVQKYISDYKMDNSTIVYFLSKVGNNIINIENELNKLMLYKLESKEITKEDINLLVIDNIEESIYDLVSSILKNENKKAIKLYNDFKLNGMDVNALLPIIASQFRLLFQVKRLYNEGKTNEEIAKILDIKNVYRIKYLLSDSYYYSEDDLKNYLLKLSNIDRDIKFGRSSGDIDLQMFIVKKDL